MELENLERLDDLPVFPLATVLFPGAVLPLHIFEERYKSLMQFAIEHEGLFGLSYRRDAAVGRQSMLDLGSVGCVAKINAVMPLEEGKMNLLAIGVIRYRILELKQVVPFLIARAEPLTDDLDDFADSKRLFEDLKNLSIEFLKVSGIMDEAGIPVDQNLPEDPEPFSLLVASLLPVGNDSKQSLLEMTSTGMRLERLKRYITELISQYNKNQKIHDRAKGNGHGKLD